MNKVPVPATIGTDRIRIVAKCNTLCNPVINCKINIIDKFDLKFTDANQTHRALNHLQPTPKFDPPNHQKHPQLTTNIKIQHQNTSNLDESKNSTTCPAIDRLNSSKPKLVGLPFLVKKHCKEPKTPTDTLSSALKRFRKDTAPELIECNTLYNPAIYRNKRIFMILIDANHLHGPLMAKLPKPEIHQTTTTQNAQNQPKKNGNPAGVYLKTR